MVLGPVREEEREDTDTAIIPLPVIIPPLRDAERGGVIVVPSPTAILRRLRRRSRTRPTRLPREKIRVSAVLRRQGRQPVAVIRLNENQVDRGVVRQRDMDEVAGYVRRGARYIRDVTPVKTGLLKSTIRPSGVIRGRAGMRIRARTFYAGFVEFGTRYITPRRYMARGLARMVGAINKRKYEVTRAGF